MKQVLTLTLLMLVLSFGTIQAQSNFALPKVARSQQHTQSSTPREHKQSAPNKKVTPSKVRQQERPSSKVEPSFDQMSDYELELAASKGNVDAQYALGRRWVLRGDSVSVAKGVNWLKAAAANGSQKARNVLRSSKY